MTTKQQAFSIMLETAAELAANIGTRRGWTIERTQEWVRSMHFAEHLVWLVIGDHPYAILAEITVELALDRLIMEKMVIDAEFTVIVIEVVEVIELIG